ncbi:nitrogenase component 1 [Bacteroidales bacterium OttesenSCG-928-A17]|nr:nitrogenase component 1 [Bacteroidales bacterium OttesenSCG-928-A17]
MNSINQSAFKALEAWDHEEIKKLLEEMRDTILAICDREYGLDRLKILADAELNLFDEKNSN